MTNIDNPFGERAQQNSRITRVTSVTVILFITLVACKLGQAVLEPVVFAVFIIAIASPLQKSMQAREGKAIALSVTVVMTAAVILALFALIAWGGREVVEWVRQNLDRIQEPMTTSLSNEPVDAPGHMAAAVEFD